MVALAVQIAGVFVALVVHEFLEIGLPGLRSAAGAAAALFLAALVQTAQLCLSGIGHIAVMGAHIFIAGEAAFANGAEGISTLLTCEAPFVAKQHPQELQEHKDHGQHDEGAPAAAAVQILGVLHHLVLGVLHLGLVVRGQYQSVEFEFAAACTCVNAQAHACDFLGQHLLQHLAANKGGTHGHNGHKDHGGNGDGVLGVCAHAVD